MVLMSAAFLAASQGLSRDGGVPGSLLEDPAVGGISSSLLEGFSA
jgi:hypothetical protein